MVNNIDIRAEFPLLERQINGNPLVYLDNSATTPKPRKVIDAILKHYTYGTANVHRGLHTLSEEATSLYEGTRRKVADWIGANSEKEVIFTSGTTAAINLVAYSYARKTLKPGDEILITQMEHHSNIVPWQLMTEETGATLKVCPMLKSGDLDLEAYDRLLTERTKIVSFVHISNALGTVNPAKLMIQKAKKFGAIVVVDGAQAVAHEKVNVKELGCDFYAFSGHKFYGPSGIGCLWGRYDLLNSMPPFMGGGDMIISVRFDKTLYAPPPTRFEAGTPSIASVIGLGAAVDFLNEIGISRIHSIEDALRIEAEERLKDIPGVQLIGQAKQKAAIVSFIVDGIHPHDLGTLLDQDGIAVRAGHHCTQPVMEFYGVPATARASFAIFNTSDDIDKLCASVKRARELFS